jgi:hypothetical protein
MGIWAGGLLYGIRKKGRRRMTLSRIRSIYDTEKGPKGQTNRIFVEMGEDIVLFNVESEIRALWERHVDGLGCRGYYEDDTSFWSDNISRRDPSQSTRMMT